MHALRTVFKKEIVTEFFVPENKTNKVIIFCSGMPGYPSRDKMKFFHKKGYWVFTPRYRGSWESKGKFLKKSPHQDILDIIDELPKGFDSLWDNKKYKINNPEIYLIGSSFGGPAAILCSDDKRVKKVITFSPVIDWTKQKNTEEPLDFIEKFTKNAFINAYRFNKKDWNKLRKGKFYNPAGNIEKVNPKKIWIIHAKDDKMVPFKESFIFSKKTGCKFTPLKKGGHGTSKIMKNFFFYRKINKFFN